MVCSLVEVYHCFREMCSYLQGREAAHFPETRANLYQKTHCHILEDNSFQIHHYEKMKPGKRTFVLG